MSKMISYDFTVGSLVSVKAPEGTDPETLIDAAMRGLIQGARDGDIVLEFDTCFDGETGEYFEDWGRYDGNDR